ncbi:PKD domain-containing protein [Halohasta salina]|uniref:PKD domain-containing protein n=1 Tax=Halohasta salina TaxID=2961621 RepID=UPI0020A59ABA|nr:PKD domain-containing protein [Halohasta salina]
MNSTRQTTVLSGLVALLMITSLFAPAVSAQPEQPADDEPADDEERTYRIVQGDQEFEVRPIQGELPVEEFYDYRYPYQSREDPSWGRSFSSEGTTEFQQDDTSILMLCEGPNGVSLVAIHDKYYEDRENGTAGSSVSWELTGLPEDGEWAVIDDDYDWRNETVEKDDIHQLGADHRTGAAGNDGDPPEGVDARLSWVWSNGRTDGMAYRGLGGENVSITIDPAFNGDSYHRFGDDRRPDEDPDDPEEGPEYNGTIDDWQVISATEDGEEIRRAWFDSLEEEVRIETAPATEPVTASLSGPDRATVGENATFTANATDDVEGYEWTVDGTPIDSADESTLTHSFDEAGTATVNVTVATADERTDTASHTVDVAEAETETQTAEDSTPGFGIGAALAALGGVLLLAARRRGT